MNLAALQPGFRFPPTHLILDRETVARYVAAVEDGSPLYAGPGAVAPPLAVLALAMRDLSELIARHPGVVHLSQKIEVVRPVPVGAAVTTQLVVQGASRRRGNLLLTLEALVESGGSPSLSGTLLLLVPPPGAESHG